MNLISSKYEMVKHNFTAYSNAEMKQKISSFLFKKHTIWQKNQELE